MTKKQGPDVFETASNRWQDSMDRKDYSAAIKTGIDAYLHYHVAGNEQFSRGALNLIHVAISQLSLLDDSSTSSASCSFCGRRGSEVPLGAGPDAYICADCAEIFHQILKPKPPMT